MKTYFSWGLEFGLYTFYVGADTFETYDGYIAQEIIYQHNKGKDSKAINMIKRLLNKVN